MVSIEKNVCASSGQASGLRSAGQRLMLLAKGMGLQTKNSHIYIYIYIHMYTYIFLHKTC